MTRARAQDVQTDRRAGEAFLRKINPLARYWTFRTFDEVVVEDGDGNFQQRDDPSLTVVLRGTLDECWDRLVKLNARGAAVFIEGAGPPVQHEAGISASARRKLSRRLGFQIWKNTDPEHDRPQA